MENKTYRLSHNATLFLKIFFPTFWIVFFGLLIAAIFVVGGDELPVLASSVVKYPILVFFLVFLLLFYVTIMSLKRVDADGEYLYVSNYFKTYRYKLVDLDYTKESNFGLTNVIKIYLKEKGSFGKSMFFILNRPTFDDYLSHFPENHVYFQLKS